jgi:histidinol-phosphatase
MPHSDFLATALEAARAAADVVGHYYRRNVKVTIKADKSPVTEADVATEQTIRGILAAKFPAHGFYGEETGQSAMDAEYVWVVDPIDGTKNYIRGVPVWATLISLMIEDQVVVGVVSAPALGKRWWASYGDGAWTGRALHSSQPCRVSDVSRIEDASLSYASLKGWEKIGRKDQWADLMESVWRTRAYGDFWSYMLVAEGAADLAAEPELALWDMAALVPIVVEAGGTFTGLNGQPGPGSLAASVEVVEYLGDEQLGHLRLGEHQIVVKLPVEPRLRAGEHETFSVPLDKVLLFDEESSLVVGPAA